MTMAVYTSFRGMGELSPEAAPEERTVRSSVGRVSLLEIACIVIVATQFDYERIRAKSRLTYSVR